MRLVVLAVLASLPAAAQELDFKWKAELYTDLRVETDKDVTFERSESGASAEVSGRYGNNILGKFHLEMVLTERGTASTFDELNVRQALDPLRFESDSLFVTFLDAGLDGFDISLGRKQLIWGSADKFHPTSNFNALDVEDPLAFGDTIATEMLHLRYQPYFVFGGEDDPWFEEFFVEAVLAPFFKPAQLPGSAKLAFVDVDEQIRLAPTEKVAGMARKQKAYLEGGATNTYTVDVEQPDFNLENAAVGVRMGWKFFGVDMSVSWFRGYDEIPRAESVVVTGDTQEIYTDVKLTFPRIDVLGVDMATSLDFLDGLGLWAEVAVVFHNDLYVTIDGTQFAGNAGGEAFQNGPELEHAAGHFVKATVGTDYTPVDWLYMNVQYLHGFVDEFGTKNLDDYLVAGMDFIMAHDTVRLRLFGIVDFQDSSWVLFPQIIAKPFSGGEFSIGAFLFGAQFYGDTQTKFGSPVAGASTVFAKARILF